MASRIMLEISFNEVLVPGTRLGSYKHPNLTKFKMVHKVRMIMCISQMREFSS